MFNTMTFGAGDQFKSLIYPQKHPETINYLQQQFNNLPNLVTEQAVKFFQEAKKVTDWVTSTEVFQMARNAVKNVFGGTEIVRDDVILSLTDLVQFQTAGLMMQRFIMAKPEVKQMYRDQMCDGYSRTYVDPEINGDVKDHYDYRLATDGMFQYQEDNGYKYYHYLDSLKEGDRVLTFAEKVDIQHTWDNMDILMAISSCDPTDPAGGDL